MWAHTPFWNGPPLTSDNFGICNDQMWPSHWVPNKAEFINTREPSLTESLLEEQTIATVLLKQLSDCLKIRYQGKLLVSNWQIYLGLYNSLNSIAITISISMSKKCNMGLNYRKPIYPVYSIRCNIGCWIFLYRVATIRDYDLHNP